MLKQQVGGKVVAAGGYGCIFDPALKCENIQEESNGQLSKLMTVKHAEDEFKQIEKFKRILSVIPNYDDYFLLNNIRLCNPSKLTKSDLKGYHKKCKPLKKKGISSKNINDSLEKVMAINMPNGGVDIEKFIKKYFFKSNIIKLNNSLIELLIKGIVPMNKLNVFHCDIKDANVLVDDQETDIQTRLIDWGISIVYKEEQQKGGTPNNEVPNNKVPNNEVPNNGIPRKLYRRPFQFNVPFSTILFNKDFLLLYNNFLKLNPSPHYFDIREFVINYIFIWNDIRGSGHFSSINEIIKKLTIKDLPAIKNNKIKDNFIEYDFTYYYIIEYISKVLQKYTNNGHLNLMEYFENVFLKILIFGDL